MHTPSGDFCNSSGGTWCWIGVLDDAPIFKQHHKLGHSASDRSSDRLHMTCNPFPKNICRFIFMSVSPRWLCWFFKIFFSPSWSLSQALLCPYLAQSFAVMHRDSFNSSSISRNFSALYSGLYKYLWMSNSSITLLKSFLSYLQEYCLLPVVVLASWFRTGYIDFGALWIRPCLCHCQVGIQKNYVQSALESVFIYQAAFIPVWPL